MANEKQSKTIEQALEELERIEAEYKEIERELEAKASLTAYQDALEEKQSNLRALRDGTIASLAYLLLKK